MNASCSILISAEERSLSAEERSLGTSGFEWIVSNGISLIVSVCSEKEAAGN